jgi:hypothetical protein
LVLIAIVCLLGLARLSSNNRAAQVQARIDTLETNERDVLAYFNARSRIRNTHLPPLPPSAIPIVMYVYDRVDDFRKALQYLKSATDIEKTVLIISQDSFVPEVAVAISEIDFVRVKHIIHPIPLKERGSIFSLRQHWW